MAYRFIDLKKSKKKLLGFFFLVLLVVGLGFYWNYKMNYEMIVKFTQLDESDSSFPFGERSIDASPWIKQGYRKIDNYQIYNPNPKPLKKDIDLMVAISICTDDYQREYSELYHNLNKKGGLDEYLKKDIKIEYIGSYFNEYSNLPTNDNFFVSFDDYQVKIERKLEEGSTYLFAYDLTRIASPE